MKQCRECGLPGDGRVQYHPECRTRARERAKSERRRCSRCKRVLAASAFSNDSTRTSGKFPYCISCQVAATAAGKVQDMAAKPNGRRCGWCETEVRGHPNRKFCSSYCKDKVKRVLQFGLTVAQYRAIEADAGGRCPICQRRPKFWAIDHDHRSRRVTGLVCTGCNVGALAFTFHDVEVVRRLLAYLEQAPAERLGIVVQVSDAVDSTEPKLHKVWTRTTPR